MSHLGNGGFGAYTFCGSSFPNDKCGANGLPLTPNSIKIFGRFQKLKTLLHPNLCHYIDLVRGTHERVIIVYEYHTKTLESTLSQHRNSNEILQFAHSVLSALAYLNKHGVIHRNLEPSNILFTQDGKVKLSKFGTFYMTDYGTDVSFAVGNPKYMSPEVLSQGPVQVYVGETSMTSDQPPSSSKADVWSLGIILIEIILKSFIWTGMSLPAIFTRILSFIRSEKHPLDILMNENVIDEKLQEYSSDIAELIRSCLAVHLKSRLNAKTLLQKKYFNDFTEEKEIIVNYPWSTELRCKNLTVQPFDEDEVVDEEDHLSELNIDTVYYLWQLAGGDLEGIMKKAGLIQTHPPITHLARYVTDVGEMHGQDKDHSVLLDDASVPLSLTQLRERLEHLDADAYYPLLEEDPSNNIHTSLPTSPSSVDLSEIATLPLSIREKDIEYQFHRVLLYERLLLAYPYKRPHIWKEARVDIPPLHRAHIWAALLEVERDVQNRYNCIDKETETPTDRQIEVDIPRCHQYNDLLSSPVGHVKFKRILKAWTIDNPQYVYWQGLDSLCAPFLYLNFNDEALAFACLSNFIPKYLHKFFLKDNSAIIQEYLAVFGHLIAFHEPELSTHLDTIGFIPDLYAIPWFLTMYAHVFPLHKIFHLWDTLLLGNSSFPLCIGVAILQQFKSQLLSFGFNECILLFSDMPEIDIQRCVQDSIKIFCSTPKSSTFRQHARPGRQHKSATPSRPNMSYYSMDYHEQPKSNMSMEPISLNDLKKEKCARISAEDLIELCELAGSSPTKSPTKSTRSSKPKLLVIDIRPQEEFSRGAISGSINIPFSTSFTPDGELTANAGVKILNKYKQQIKVIVGSRGNHDIQFAENLLGLGYSKVCVLHKGVDILKPTGLLVLPSPEL